MNMNERFILKVKELERVNNSTLFYPCSGNDLLLPIELFSPYVTDFWFVDRGYFSPGHQDTKDFGLDVSADKQPLALVLGKDTRYEYVENSRKIDGPPSWRFENRDISPCILSETYRHKETHREIRIHLRRGYGFSAFRSEIKELGVFFYRGDSWGEGGSGNLWLEEGHMDEVCNKLIDCGLIVSDGSDGSPRCGYREGGVYKEMWKYSWKEVSMEIDALVASFKSFTDSKGRILKCVGYAGRRYGPTMIWQVMKPAKPTTLSEVSMSKNKKEDADNKQFDFELKKED
jgi:hypothetical protein